MDKRRKVVRKIKKNKEETFYFTEQRRNFIVHDIDGKENIEGS